MRLTFKTFATGAILVATGCQAGGETASLETDDQKASYAIGLQVGRSMEQISDHIDLAALRQGIADQLAGAETALTPEELDAVMRDFETRMREEQAAAAERSQAEGLAYLEENGQREGVQTTPSGLQYEVLREGDGAKPTATDQVVLHYRGTLIDGTEFDSSYERNEPATFAVNAVIPGFSEGIQLMNVGSQYRFHIGSDLGYGPQGSPPTIAPNATLVFEVELLEIVE